MRFLLLKARTSPPGIVKRYNALKKRRGHKKAVIAIARMLLTAIFSVLKKHEPYPPELYRKSDTPPEISNVPFDKSVFILQRQRYLFRLSLKAVEFNLYPSQSPLRRSVFCACFYSLSRSFINLILQSKSLSFIIYNITTLTHGQVADSLFPFLCLSVSG